MADRDATAAAAARGSKKRAEFLQPLAGFVWCLLLGDSQTGQPGHGRASYVACSKTGSGSFVWRIQIHSLPIGALKNLKVGP